MCDTGECRQCRREARELDKEMGVERTYIQGRLPGLVSNIEGRKVVGNGLVSSESSRPNLSRPRTKSYDGLSREAKRKLRQEERLRERVEEMVNGVPRMVSVHCPCHGTYSGYQNWYCHCGHCQAAHERHHEQRKLNA